VHKIRLNLNYKPVKNKKEKKKKKKLNLNRKNIRIIYNYNRMIIPIKCFTCGMVLADKYRFFCEEVRKKKLAKNLNTQNEGQDVEKVLYLTKEFHDKTPEGETLDELGLKKMCCRTKMLTHVDID
jgi:DNA-directed RNA polymerase subunit N (RpoN/RPB10)